MTHVKQVTAMPKCSVTRREVKARVATYFWFVLLLTINGRPLTGGTNMDSG